MDDLSRMADGVKTPREERDDLLTQVGQLRRHNEVLRAQLARAEARLDAYRAVAADLLHTPDDAS